MTDPIDIHRRTWDERVAIHSRDTTRDDMLDRFRAGDDALHDVEAPELGDITSKRGIHSGRKRSDDALAAQPPAIAATDQQKAARHQPGGGI